MKICFISSLYLPFTTGGAEDEATTSKEYDIEEHLDQLEELYKEMEPTILIKFEKVFYAD